MAEVYAGSIEQVCAEDSRGQGRVRRRGVARSSGICIRREGEDRGGLSWRLVQTRHVARSLGVGSLWGVLMRLHGPLLGRLVADSLARFRINAMSHGTACSPH
jgi:hypothetical protein